MIRNSLPIFALLLLSVTGCATIPNAKQLSARPGGKAPIIEGAHHDLTPAQGEHAMKTVARYSGDGEILQRQVAVEGQVAGTPLVAGNKVELVQNGRPTYDLMEQAILAAKTNISVESYTIEGDAIGTAITDLLIEKHRQGVAVEIIYDSYGSVDTPAAFWDRIKAEGIPVVEYNPLNAAKAKAGYDPNDRDHRKCMIIDGELAIMGGINISEIYLYGGTGPGSTDRYWVPWRDTDIRVEGPVVAKYQQFFLDVWAAQKGGPLPNVQFFPRLQTAGPSYVRAVPGTPQAGDPQIYVALLSAIRHAEKNVWLTTAYFDPTPEARQVLADAARRGVDVELSVEGQTDSQATLAAGRSHYSELLEAGVKISERWDVFLHGKTSTIDGVWSIVGSSNLDTRSVIWNNELSSIVLSHEFAAQMEAAFTKDFEAGTQIDLKDWKKRSLVERAKEWGARTLEVML
ncbi:MAG: Phospholipase D/Transphosphatidylase [Rhodospirillales bacterium]|nr:Phospholipase D/Transphosphatidylase [Rhodospirillales bacterium]